MKTTFRSKRDIHPQHIAKFYKVLRRIDNHITLNWENIDKQFKLLKKWPKREDVEYTFAALDTLTALECLPFQVAIAAVGPPSVVSVTDGLFEFRIYDEVKRLPSSLFKCNTPVSLSVFPSGREILRIPGLVLDSFGEKSGYPQRQLNTDKLIVRQSLTILTLLKKLIEEFPVSDDRGKVFRAQALEDLSGSVRPMFG